MDLLEHAQQLVARGNTNHNAHVIQLQELVQEKQPNEIKSVENKQANNSPIQPKNSSVNNLLTSWWSSAFNRFCFSHWLLAR